MAKVEYDENGRMTVKSDGCDFRPKAAEQSALSPVESQSHGSVWIETAKQKPKPYQAVIGWNERRSFCICYWINHDDCPDGGFWSVNGDSGLSIKPPVFWIDFSVLPDLPNTQHEPTRD